MTKLLILSFRLLSLCLHGNIAQANEAPNWLSKINVAGYASAGITIDRDAANSASLNEVSLWLSTNHDSRWQLFSEIEIEEPLSWNEDEDFNNTGAAIDIERLYLDYNLAEHTNLRFGRFLNPTSRWNLLHAPPLVWTSTRPLATNWLFPVSTTGAMLFGAIPTREAIIEYTLFTEITAEKKVSDQDLKFKNVFGAKLSYQRSFTEISASLLSFKEKGLNQKYTMVGLNFHTNINNIEISAEGFQRFTDSRSDGGSGAFVQTAVPLNNVGLANWYWVTRLETLDRPDDGANNRWLVGATWRIKPRQLLKLAFTGGSDAYPDAPRGFLTSFALFF